MKRVLCSLLVATAVRVVWSLPGVDNIPATTVLYIACYIGTMFGDRWTE